MFNGVGLKSKAVFDWLVEFHNLLKEELPMGDKPNVQCLLKAGEQVLQHLGQGYDLPQALKTVCCNVYVQNQRHTKSKQVGQSSRCRAFQCYIPIKHWLKFPNDWTLSINCQ